MSSLVSDHLSYEGYLLAAIIWGFQAHMSGPVFAHPCTKDTQPLPACSRLFSVSECLWDWSFRWLSRQFVKVFTCCQDKNLHPHNQDFRRSTLC